VDGDTLHFTNDKCRILYIDTPESYRNKKAKRDVKQCKNFTLDTMVKIGKYNVPTCQDHLTEHSNFTYYATSSNSGTIILK